MNVSWEFKLRVKVVINYKVHIPQYNLTANFYVKKSYYYLFIKIVYDLWWMVYGLGVRVYRILFLYMV